MDKIHPPRHSSQPPRRYKNINTDITLKCGPSTINAPGKAPKSHKDDQFSEGHVQKKMSSMRLSNLLMLLFLSVSQYKDKYTIHVIGKWNVEL